MARTRHALSVSVLSFSLLSVATAPLASAQDAAGPEQLWSDFAHYVLIARPGLANDAGNALLDADAGALLDAVEASDHAQPSNVFDRAAGMDDLAAVAGQVQQKIESARLDRSRDAQRIGDNIELLSQGTRPYLNAVRRLKTAGQYAAPQLLSTLGDVGKESLHPFVLQAMIDIGQPLVAPLSAALPDLEPVTQSQVAEVLARIGYPEALPAIHRLIENPDTDPAVLLMAQKASESLREGIRNFGNPTAAELYLGLGEATYAIGTDGGEPVGFDSSKNAGLIWRYGRDIGLVPLEVPATVYADALARDAAVTALSLDAELDDALTLYLASDLRAGNNLGDADDPSRPDAWQPAEYYALLAGPQRLRDVLDTALDDGDSALALDAIDALAQTASIDALQPLTRALSYADRRVRFRAAEALASALPQESFTNDNRVVPVLAEAVRQGESQIALVLAEDQAKRNKLADAASSLGYEPISGATLSELSEAVRNAAGIDLIVVDGSKTKVSAIVEQSAQNYKLAGSPVIGNVSAADNIALTGQYGEGGRVATFVGEATAETLGKAADRIAASYSGQPIGAEEAEAFALSALDLIEDIAETTSVYNASDALPAVIAALSDARPAVATAAAEVISAMDDSQAQAALASAALESVGDVQIAQLGSLAQSANRFGNLVSAESGDALLKLVSESEGDLALAAAKAHGAMSLPTSNAVQLILENR